MILKTRGATGETKYIDTVCCKPVNSLHLDDFNLVTDMALCHHLCRLYVESDLNALSQNVGEPFGVDFPDSGDLKLPCLSEFIAKLGNMGNNSREIYGDPMENNNRKMMEEGKKMEKMTDGRR
ncbi:hypothetical protein F2Q70_00002563 [Brassica cretica]|uniref:Uncharacterized protein n=1 Tax=Brassica cretica TaxID=69181 RepID=A0A3N6Q4T3_BRACR|nr:hypothetical protein F2Q70_00002563 [Brassica cretica]KAF3569269.1 hypothetical protein DY000_02014051 [Brassica cretica]